MEPKELVTPLERARIVNSVVKYQSLMIIQQGIDATFVSVGPQVRALLVAPPAPRAVLFASQCHVLDAPFSRTCLPPQEALAFATQQELDRKRRNPFFTVIPKVPFYAPAVAACVCARACACADLIFCDATAASPPRRPLCQDLSCELGKEVYLWYREGKGRQCICKIDVKDKPGKVRDQKALAQGNENTQLHPPSLLHVFLSSWIVVPSSLRRVPLPP